MKKVSTVSRILNYFGLLSSVCDCLRFDNKFYRRGRKAKTFFPESRHLCMEPLEERALLTVTATEYDTIRTEYADFGLSETMSDVNIIEIEAANLTLANLKAAIAKVGTTTGDVAEDLKDDLIVVRTTDAVNTISYINTGTDEIIIDTDSTFYGKLNIVGYGTRKLTLNAAQNSRVLTISAGLADINYTANLINKVNLGNITFTGGDCVSSKAYTYWGGGICNFGTLVLVDCTISDNANYYASNAFGGGIANYSNASLTMNRCAVSGNIMGKGRGYHRLSGGGISNGYNGVLLMTECIVSNNSIIGYDASLHYGGGIDNNSQFMKMINCVVSDNLIRGISYGGGIYNSKNSCAEIITCTINNNSLDNTQGTCYGGGICNGDYSVVKLVGCEIYENSTDIECYKFHTSSSGGGVFNQTSSTVTITNCTIVGNSAGQKFNIAINASHGGGICSDRYVLLTIHNSIIVDNYAKDGGDEYQDIDHTTETTIIGSHNISSYWGYDSDRPLFVDKANNDYQLVTDSPAVNKGSNEIAEEFDLTISSLDRAKQYRICDGIIDLGAYELQMGIALSQSGTFRGKVQVSSKGYEGAQSLKLTWISDAESVVLGTFAAVYEYTWDTARITDSAGFLKADYLDATGRVVRSTSYRGTVLNDQTIVIHSGTICADETWDSDKVHLVVGKVTVSKGVMLTIAENTVVKFQTEAYLNVMANSVVFIEDGAVLTRAEDDTVVGDTNKDGNKSVPRIGDDYFRGSGTVTMGTDIQVKYVSQIFEGDITQNTKWSGNQVYHITDTIYIDSDTTLTIAPGAILKFDPGCSLVVYGVLIAEGTVAEPIIFTSVKDDSYGGDTDEDDGEYGPQAGDWTAIRVHGGTASLNYAKVLYGGSDPDNSDDGAIYVASGEMELHNSVVAHSKLVGTHCGSGATLNVYNSVIEDCMYATHNGNYTNCTLTGLTHLMNTHYYYYGGTFVNCIISDVSDSFFGGNTPSNYAFNNCVFYNPKGIGPQSFSYVGTNGNIWANPGFRNAVAGDYHLTAGSPCIDAANGSVAPKNDITNAPRVTDTHVTARGTITTEGKYADIGAYEFADNANSPVDLGPVDIQFSEAVSVGETVTIQWTVRNFGSVAATGTWTDEIYLVSDSGQKVFVKAIVHSGNIAAGDMQTFTAEVAVPNVVEGNWYFAVSVNPNREIFEGVNNENNYISSSRCTQVSVPLLNGLTNVGISKGSLILYRLEVPANEEKYITADSPSVTLLVRDTFVPDDSLYDAKSTVIDNMTLLHIALSSTNRIVYILVFSQTSISADLEVMPAGYVPPATAETEVNWDASSSFTVELKLPDSVRSGRIYQASFTVTNTSTYNIPVPLLSVRSDGDAIIAMTAEEIAYGANAISVAALSTGTDLTVLKAGESTTISFYFKTGNNNHIVLSSVPTGKDRPYSEGNPYWTTWQDYHVDILNAAKILAARGTIVYDTNVLQRFATMINHGADTTGISGHLVNRSSGEPMAGYVVTAQDKETEDSIPYTATTDNSGYFCFNYLPANVDISLSVDKADILSQSVVELIDGKDVVNLNILAESFGVIKGDITIDSSTESLEGVYIIASVEGEQDRCVLTDVKGQYIFDDLPAGEYVLSVETYGRFLSIDPVSVTVLNSTYTTLNFSLQQGYAVNGKITEEVFRNPVASAFVALYDGDELVCSVLTDSTGEFHIYSDRELSNCSVKILTDDYMRVTLEHYDATQYIEIALQTSDVVVSGTYLLPSGYSDENLFVIASNDYDSIFAAVEDGYYTFYNLAQGTYCIDAFCGNYYCSIETVTVGDVSINLDKLVFSSEVVSCFQTKNAAASLSELCISGNDDDVLHIMSNSDYHTDSCPRSVFIEGKSGGIHEPPAWPDSMYESAMLLDRLYRAHATGMVVVEAMRTLFGREVANLYTSFLTSDKDDYDSYFFGNGSRVVNGTPHLWGVGFRKHERTKNLTETLLLDAIDYCHKYCYDYGAGNLPSVFPIGPEDTDEELRDKLYDTIASYNDAHSIPGVIAGGLGGGDFIADSREVTGYFTVDKKEVDSKKISEKSREVTYEIKVTGYYSFLIIDVVDFIPGNLATGITRKFTTQLRFLEEYGWAYDVPFRVFFQEKLESLPFTVKEIIVEEVEDEEAPEVPQSEDPNEIEGPVGVDYVWYNVGTEEELFKVITGNNWINGNGDLAYKVYFENKASATAAAQEIRVSMAVSEAWNWDTYSVNEIAIGSDIFTLSDSYLIAEDTWLVPQASTGEQVKVVYTYNDETRLAQWYLRSWVESTLDHYPESAYDGFLPPNNDYHDGEGYISFTVSLKDSVETRTRIESNATIIFDYNEPIVTNTWINTIDNIAPMSVIASVTEAEDGDLIVEWSGEDEHSGIASYDIYYSTDGGNHYTLWLSETTDTIGDFTPSADGDYLFKAIACDWVGNTNSGLSASITITSDRPIIHIGQDEYIVQEGCSLFISAEESEGEDLTYLWNFKGTTNESDYIDTYGKSFWISTQALGFEAGTHTIKLRIRDESGIMSRPAVATITVAEVPPCITVDQSSFLDGQVLKLDLSAFYYSRVARQWTVNWGDGNDSSVYDIYSSHLTCAHYYGDPGDYPITLKLVDSNDKGGDITYYLGTHTVPGTQTGRSENGSAGNNDTEQPVIPGTEDDQQVFTVTSDNWYDAEKSGASSSSNLCWAGSTANILYYTGWANGDMTDADLYSYTFESEDDVINYFVNHFTNGSGSVYYAVDWFLTGNNSIPTTSGWAQNDVSGGGFYTNMDIDNVRKYYDYNDTDAPETILPEVAELLVDGYGISMSLGVFNSSPNGTLLSGHAVTLWGYTADPTYESTDPEYYTSLKITDSDDDKYLGRSAPDQLVTVDIHWNSQYQKYQVLNYGSTNRTYWIEEFVAIAPKTEELLRNVVVPTASSISDSILAAALLWEQKSNPAMLSSSSLLNTDKRMVDPIRSQKAFEYQPMAATGLDSSTVRTVALNSIWDDDFTLHGVNEVAKNNGKSHRNTSLESEIFGKEDLDDLFTSSLGEV